MSSQLILYTNPHSRGRIAHWILEEIGAPHTIQWLNFQTAEHKRPEFMAINPMGKVPTLVCDGIVVTKAGAICAFIADRFPNAGLAPATEATERAPYLRWLFFSAGCIEPALTDKMLSRALPENRGALGYGGFDQVFATLKLALQPGPYLLGERFSAADVHLASMLEWAKLATMLPDDPIFQDYLEAALRRPAYGRMNAACAAQRAAWETSAQ